MLDKINVKKSILEIVEKNNLEILKIDLYNDEESFVKFDEYCKFYTTLEDLDFEVESIFMYDKVRGMVYCRDKDTKEPVWIVSCGDEGGSWWEIDRVPEFYKNNLNGQSMEKIYKKDIDKVMPILQALEKARLFNLQLLLMNGQIQMVTRTEYFLKLL